MVWQISMAQLLDDDAYDTEFPPLKALKFSVACGNSDLKLNPVPIAFEDGAIIIDADEEAEAGRRWECCLSRYTIGLNPHLSSLSEFLHGSGNWQVLLT